MMGLRGETVTVSTELLADGRRRLRFQSLHEVLADAERLAAGPVQTLGQWTFPQIVQHIADAMRGSLDGFGFQAPWLARTLIAPLVKNSLLTKGMKPGFKLPDSAQSLLPAKDVTLDAAMDCLRKVVARFESEQPQAPHPFLGKLASQEHHSLHMRHSELHLSFVVPAS